MRWKSLKLFQCISILGLISATNVQAGFVKGTDYIDASNNEHEEFINAVKQDNWHVNPEPKDFSDLVWAKTAQFIGFYRRQVGTAYDWVSYEEATAHLCQGLIEHARITGNQVFSCSAANPRFNDGFNEWMGVVNYRARYKIGVTPSPYDRPSNFRHYLASAPKDGDSCDNPNFPAGPIKISETQSICMASKYEDLLEQGESECMAGNPVNVATGNKYQAEVDAVLRGFAITRDYNSTAAKSNTLGHFGMGWNSGFNKQLTIQGANLVLAHRDSGKLNVFEKTGSGQFKLKNQPQVSLKKRGNKYHYSDAKWKETYDANGKLLSFTKRGTALEWKLKYTSASSIIPSEISNRYGDKIKIELNRAGLIHSVSLNNAYTLEYQYDRQKRLVQVQRPEQFIEYHYNAIICSQAAVSAASVMLLGPTMIKRE